MLERLQWSGGRTRWLVPALAALALAASAFAGWRLLGARETDSFSEGFTCSEAFLMAAGHDKFGIGQLTHYPNGPTYALIPWIDLGIRDPAVLRRVPFVFGLLCEGLLLAAIAAMRVTAARRLWLILAIGTIYLQPGVAGWLGCLHEHSYCLSLSFALLAAATALGRRFRPAAFALAFLTGWMGYDFLLAQLWGTVAIRWLVHCGDAPADELAGPLRNTVLDGVAVGGAMALAVFTHLLQNAVFFGSFSAAFKDLIGAASARMAIKAGASLSPEYYKWIAGAAQARGNPPRLEILYAHLAVFFTTVWTYPSQFELLGGGILLTAAAALLKPPAAPRSSPRTIAVRAGIFSLCVLFCVCGWIFLMPRHAALHLHFLPRHFFVAATVIALASVMLPDAFFEKERLDGRSPDPADAPAPRGSWLPALRISGALGIFFFVLSLASRGFLSGSALRWRIFVLFGSFMSGWALVTRVKRRTKRSEPRSRRAVAFFVGLAGLSAAYAFYRAGAEIFSGLQSGLPVFLTVITAVMVIGKHELERKALGSGWSVPRGAAALVAPALVLVCGLVWLETGRLMFWGSFSGWISSDRTLFWKAALLCALVPLLLIGDVPHSDGSRRKVLLSLDVLAVLVLFIFSFEKDLLLAGGGDFNYPVFIAPVNYIRSGGRLLWDVPSAYGFLNILLVSALKPFKAPEAFYLVNSTLIFLGTLVSYFAFRLAWPALGAPLVGIPFILATSIFLPGVAPGTYTPQLFPSDGPFRYMACYLLILPLLLHQLSGWKEKFPLRRVMLAGNCAWLLGCLWSAESLAYSSAIWFPALLLLDGEVRRREPESLWRTFIHSVSLLGVPALLLGGAMAVLSADYVLRIGHLPDFKGYFDYALSFKNGFWAYPDAIGPVDHWLVLFFFSSFLVLAFSVRSALKPLAAAALFACWAASSYYAALSYPHSLLNLVPICALALHVLIFVLRRSPIQGEEDLFARSALRALAFALIPFMLLVYFHDPSVLKQRALASLQALRTPFSTPNQLRWNGEPTTATDYARPSDIAMRASLVAMLRKKFNPVEARCVINLQNYWENDPEQQFLWAPFLSATDVWALSSEVRLKYWDRFMARVNSSAPGGKCSERWLTYNDRLLDSDRYVADNDHFWKDAPWKVRYLQKTMRIEREIDSNGWHLVEFSDPTAISRGPRR